MKIGAQLFTVREYCRTLPELGETLKKIADIGYTSVQVSGTCPYTAEELDPLLAAAGVSCDLTHYSYDRIIGDTLGTVEQHRAFGCNYIGIGSMPGLFGKEHPDVYECYTKFVGEAKEPSAVIASHGMKLMYHNHDREYLCTHEGRNVMELLAEAFTAEELGFTLDMHWVQRGGYDPVEEIKRLSGRLDCVHLKDLETDTLHFAPVGSGVQNYPAILAALESAGTKHAFVEQDNCYGRDPFECLAESYRYLCSLGLK